MQRDDAAGQVAPARPRVQPAAAMRGRELALVGPGLDRLGEVDVGRPGCELTRGRPAGSDAHQVLGVDRAERPPLAGWLNSQTTSRPPGRVTRSNSRRAPLDVGDVAQPERHRHGVEGVVRERQAHRVGRGERQVGAAPVAHRAACRARSRPARRRRPASANGSLLVPVPAARSSTRSPGCGVHRLEHRPAPQPVLPEREHVVGQVVACRRRRRTSRRPRGGPCPGWRGSWRHPPDRRRPVRAARSQPAPRHGRAVGLPRRDHPRRDRRHAAPRRLPRAPRGPHRGPPRPGPAARPPAGPTARTELSAGCAAARAWSAGAARAGVHRRRARTGSRDAERVVARRRRRTRSCATRCGLPGTGPVAFGSFVVRRRRPPRAATLVVPEVVVGRRGDGAGGSPRSASAREPARPPSRRRPDAAARRRPTCASPTARCSGAEWAGAVARGGASGSPRGELDKVVLARDLRGRRRARRSTRAGCCSGWPSATTRTWVFAVDGLVGATPELLVRLEKGLVTSRVLAGTIRRTGDDAHDLALAASLARSSQGPRGARVRRALGRRRPARRTARR